MNSLKKIFNIHLKRKWILLLMAVPFVIYIVMFCYVPLAGWILAFFDYVPGISLMETEFAKKYNGNVFAGTFIQSDPRNICHFAE